MKKSRIVWISLAAAALIACLVTAIVLIVVNTGDAGHNFGPWRTVTTPNCTRYGLERRECADGDGYAEEREIARLGHKYNEENVCTVCGASIKPTEGLGYTLSADGSYYTVSHGILPDGATEVVIPRYYDGIPVDAVADDAFSGNKTITSVSIPDGVKKIGLRAFYQCEALADLTMSVETVEIGNLAFYQCTALTDAEIGPAVEKLGNSAFYGCSSLREIVLRDSLKEVGALAFNGCSAAAGIKLGNSLTEVVDGMFTDCSAVTEIVFGENITSIASNAFSGCLKLRTVSFTQKLKSIGASAFSKCDGLRRINFDGTMKKWAKLSKEPDWLAGVENDASLLFIYCTDGTVNPYGVQVNTGN